MRIKNFLLVLFFWALSLPVFSQIITQTFSYTGSVQTFTVPVTCVNTLTIEARGAGGGSVTNTCPASGGLGASMIGTFSLTPSQTLSILVGGVGISNTYDAGGGGGSYVVAPGNIPLIVAGGGGGATNYITLCGPNRNGLNASITTSGTASGDNLVPGGVNGNGGNATGPLAGGGGGFYTNGASPGSSSQPNTGGRAYINGGAGGIGYGSNGGGYGGGGAGYSQGGNGGGGGGYSGGSTSGATPRTGGGGGGSYNAGTNQTNTPGVQAGNGLVIISYYAGPVITSSSSSSSICAGSNATLSAGGAVSYTWTGGSQTQSISVNPSVTSTYTVSGTDANNCIASSVITLSVNPLPTISVSSGSICLGTSFTIAPSGASSYSFSGGQSIVTPTSNNSYSVTGISNFGCNSSNTVIATVTVVPGPILSVNSGSICFGETFTISPTGAVSYTYSGATSTVSPNTTTTYSITGSNVQGCVSGISLATVTVHPLPAVSISGVNAVCLGSSITLTGVGASTYTWNSSYIGSTLNITPTITSSYSIIGKDSNGCTNVTQKSITVNSLPSLSVSGNSVICKGLSTSLLVNGSALTYTWSEGTIGNLVIVSPSVSTVYTVVGTDVNGCVDSIIQPVLVNTLPPVTASANNNPICSGEALSLNGGGAVTYTWSGGIANGNAFYPSSTNNYTVTGTGANSCKNTATIQVVVNPLPVLTLSSNVSGTVCNGDEVELIASGANIYSWNTGDITPKITITPSITTQYSVAGTDGNGCTTTKIYNQIVLECTGISKALFKKSEIKLYPNPTKGDFIVSITESLPNLKIEIYNLLGEIIISKPLNSDKENIDLKELTTGIYFVRISQNETKIKEEKIIITE